MKPNVTEVERAYQLADSGEFEDVALLARRLRDEGYSTWHVDSPLLRKQLKARIVAAWGDKPKRIKRRRKPVKFVPQSYRRG